MSPRTNPKKCAAMHKKLRYVTYTSWANGWRATWSGRLVRSEEKDVMVQHWKCPICVRFWDVIQ